MKEQFPAASLEGLTASVLHSVAGGIAAVDDAGVQLYVNPAFTRMVGWTATELIGARPPYAYWPPEEIEAIGAAFASTVAGTAPPEGFELRFMRRDGTRFDVLVVVRPLESPDGRRGGWVASVKDIGIRRELQRERERVAAGQRFLAEAAGVLASSLDYENTLSLIAHLFVPRFADYCLVDLIEPDGSMRRVEIADTNPVRVELLRDMARRWPPHIRSSGRGPAYVAETGQAILAQEITDEMFTSYTDDPERLELLRSLGLRSCIIAPIVARGRVLGALTLNSTSDERRFDEIDLELAKALAERAGLAIDNARLYRAEQQAHVAAERAARRTGRLQALTTALSRAASVEDVANAALVHGMSALGATAGGVTLLEDDGEHQRLIAVQVAGLPRTTLESWQRFPLTAPYPVNDAVRELRVIHLESREAYTRAYPELVREMGGHEFEAYLAAPLEIEGRPLGCINYDFDDRRSLEHDDIEMILAMARQASIALERARLYESESHARALAEEANETKSRFLATMSHELRTPLNAVLGFVDLLLLEVDGTLNEAQRNRLTRVVGASSHLVNVIDEILTFSRLEADGEQLRLGRFDIGGIVRDTAVLLEPQARKAGIALQLDIPDGIVTDVDAGKLRQIVLNLLGNAIKFTEQGAAGVVLRSDASCVHVEVWDTGPGIPEDQRERIFEPFAQLDDSTTRRTGGTGLGLTVSRGLARLLGGDLTVSHREGGGSRFLLTLPQGPQRDPSGS